ncbi:hypothetical protein LUZ60_000755 [Juncus effusus]|nr:hypothetical protein LUZ60_000755 [Juncus effusus]
MVGSKPTPPILFVLTITFLLPLSESYPANPDLKSEFLIPHNNARKLVNVSKLIWDDEVAAYAEWYASIRQYDCSLIHSHGEYGENLFWGSGSGWKIAKVVAAWVVEKKNYDYETNKCDEGCMCGHYTQVVWRNTTRLGCAMVPCYGNKGTFVVCSYDPPGNYVGMWPY